MAVFLTSMNKWGTTLLAGAVLGLFPNAMAIAQSADDDLLPIPQNRPSVESYSLPPGPDNSSSQNVLQGPVDEDIPLTGPAVAPPPATPARTPTPVPAPENTSPAATSAPGNSTNSQVQQPVSPAPPRPDRTEETPAPDSASPPLQADERPAPTGRPDDTSLSPTKPVAEPPATTDWFHLSFVALLLVLLSALLLWRTRRASPKQTDPGEADRTESLPTDPISRPPEPIQPVPTIALAFQPHAANATLLNAVLSFELTLSNHGSDILTDIRVNGAMVQADQKDGSDPVVADLSPLREVQNLRTGEDEKILTEFRIPLASIRPILFRSQALFVPLVHISIEFTDGSGFQHFQTAAYLVGKEHQPPRPKMAPFRLDMGPRSFAPLGYRTLTVG